MILNTMLLAASPLLGAAPAVPADGLLAIKVGRAETVNEGTIPHAVILVEDGSTDGSLDLCRRLADDDRVRLLRHGGGANRGAGASRNVGIRHALGRYVAFLDADDYYLPGRFAAHLPLLEADAGLDGVYGAVRNVFEDAHARMPGGDSDLTAVRGRVDPDELLAALALGGRGAFHTAGITVRRDLIERTGLFDESPVMQYQDAVCVADRGQHGCLFPQHGHFARKGPHPGYYRNFC